ncbi:MAG: hypothetical protein JWM08_3044 [Candidatus Angelobacter sp.]|nr:hypothetical protein [Candidatus Angelobacter sp.]
MTFMSQSQLVTKVLLLFESGLRDQQRELATQTAIRSTMDDQLHRIPGAIRARQSRLSDPPCIQPTIIR